MKSVSQNSGVVDKGSAGHIFTLALTVLALCSHHLKLICIISFYFFLATKRIGLVLLSSMCLYRFFCVPVLPPSTVLCYTLVSRCTCWNSLYKSVTTPGVSARDISETQELLLSCRWQPEQSSTATVCPLRVERTQGLGCWPALNNAELSKRAASCGLNSSCP